MSGYLEFEGITNHSNPAFSVFNGRQLFLENRVGTGSGEKTRITEKESYQYPLTVLSKNRLEQAEKGSHVSQRKNSYPLFSAGLLLVETILGESPDSGRRIGLNHDFLDRILP